MCGWLKDAFGVSWQIVPANMGKYFSGTPEQSARVQTAILGSKKLVIAELEAAFNG
jgi:predicted 3-demethylubiquinone-9 3-methyltransferase (glyoxalase superfamily)